METNGLMDCGLSGWLGMALLAGIGFMMLLVLILAAGALGRYLVTGRIL
ncbi:hypothetical protein GRZ55_19360 [Chelativorans sp. ZYF759]|nr:hypothetical protein [Chelativorans sp. ZYF759]NMG41407.1 hypothetical protein [Chelativorans sp. ZYF759]